MSAEDRSGGMPPDTDQPEGEGEGYGTSSEASDVSPSEQPRPADAGDEGLDDPDHAG